MNQIERGQRLLRLDAVRDAFEVYRVGRIFTAEIWGVSFLCPACEQPIRKGDHARDFYTRRVGTSWAERTMHVVHERCWLKASSASGLQDILTRKTLQAVQNGVDRQAVRP